MKSLAQTTRRIERVFWLGRLLALLVVATIVARLWPLASHWWTQPHIRTTPDEIWLDRGQLLLGLVQNFVFACVTFGVVRAVARKASGKPVQWRMRTIFLVTTVMAITFAIARLSGGGVTLILVATCVCLASQAMVFAVARVVLQRLEEHGEGTFWRSLLGMLVAGTASATALLLVLVLDVDPETGQLKLVWGHDRSIVLLFFVLPLVPAAFVATFGAIVVVLWQDEGGSSAPGGLGAGLFMGSLLALTIAPFSWEFLREHVADLLSLPIFFGVGGFFANLRGPDTASKSAPPTPAAELTYADYDPDRAPPAAGLTGSLEGS